MDDDYTDDPGVRLMLAYQAGDEGAFDQLVERYSGQVWALLTRFLGQHPRDVPHGTASFGLEWTERRPRFGRMRHQLPLSALALLLPVLILGGIYGIRGPLRFTVTEAAAVAVVYALVVELFVHRELKFKDGDGGRVLTDWTRDGQAGTVLKAYREHQMSADVEFLKRNWPKIRRSLQFLIDREFIANDIYQGRALPMLTNISQLDFDLLRDVLAHG